jgi:hypothetical protein
VAATEKRTLEIIAKVTDFASRPLATISRSVSRFATQGIREFTGFAKSVLSVKTAVGVLLGGFAAFRGGAFITGIINANAELAKIARGTGSTAERLIVLKDALALTGVEGSRFKGLINVLTKAIGQALNDSSSKAAKSLRKVGITLDDLRTSDPVKLFDRLAGSLEKFASPQQKAAALIEIFPKATGEIELLVDVLGKGQDAFRNLVATAQQFGGGITEPAIKDIERMADALDLMQLSVEGVGRSVVASLSAQFAPAIERIAAFIAKNREAIGAGIANIVQVVGKAVVAVTAAFLRLVAFLSANGGKFLEALEEIPLVGEKIASGLRKVFDVPELSTDARRIRDAMDEVARAHVSLERQIEQAASGLRDKQGIPGEFTPEQLEADRQTLENLHRNRQAAYLQLIDLQTQFSATSGTDPLGQQMERQLAAARAGGFADVLSSIANFESLPAPDTDLAPIMKALFGADGVSGAEDRVRSFGEGISDGLDRLVEKWTDIGAVGESAVQVLDSGLDSLTGAFADIATGQAKAREAFRKFALGVLHDIAQMIARLTIVKAFLSAIGFGVASQPNPGNVGLGDTVGGFGGFETGGTVQKSLARVIPLRRFETGGVAHGPTVAVFGEGKARKGEAFVPLPDGRTIPVSLTGGGGVVVNNYITAMDSQSVQRALAREGDFLGSMWMRQVGHRNNMRHSIKRTAAS